MQRFLKQLFTLTLMLTATLFASAQKVTFETNAPEIVTQGEPFRIEFALNAKPDGFTPPQFSGLDVLAGPTTSQGESISVTNGAVTRAISFTYTYVLQGPTAGKFTIPIAEVKVNGQTYATQPLTLEVVSSASGAAKSTGMATDDILVRTIVNRNNVYKGQPVRVTFKLYSRLSLSGISSVKFPTFNGFWAQDLNAETDKWQRETYNGKVYNAVVLKEVLLFPQQSGKLHIEQFDLTAVAQIVSQQARARSLFDDFFGGGASVEEVRKKAVAPPVLITVKELPNGAPAGFNGAVGKFQINGDVTPKMLSANSSGVYTLKISGNGNLPLIQTPKLHLPSSFEQFNLKTTETLNNSTNGIAGYRQFEYPFIARAEGNYTIDPIEFVYFDPDQNRYISLSTQSFVLDIRPDSTGGANVDRGMISGVNKEDIKILGEDIRFIRLDNPNLHPMGRTFFGRWYYFASLLLLLGTFIFLYIYLQKVITERRNTVLVRNKRANKVALQRLRAAHGHMNADSEKAFYEEMLKALWGYMSDKLNIPAANLTKDNIREGLLKRAVTADQITRFIEIISACEYAQYSPSSSGQMSDLYRTAAEMLSKFESIIK